MKTMTIALASLLATSATAAQTQNAGHDHGAEPVQSTPTKPDDGAADHSKMDHGTMGHGAMDPNMPGMDHSKMRHDMPGMAHASADSAQVLAFIAKVRERPASPASKAACTAIISPQATGC